jgi:hypothetical protein
VVNRNGAKHLDAAFEQFVVNRSATLLRTAYLLIGDRAEAEDLLQTALLRTALKWRGVQGEPTPTRDRCWSIWPETVGDGANAVRLSIRWTTCPRH